MNLEQQTRLAGCGLESAEELRWITPRLLTDQLPDHRPRHRWRPIWNIGQGQAILHRQQIHAGRKIKTEGREDRAEAGERGAQPAAVVGSGACLAQRMKRAARAARQVILDDTLFDLAPSLP